MVEWVVKRVLVKGTLFEAVVKFKADSSLIEGNILRRARESLYSMFITTIICTLVFIHRLGGQIESRLIIGIMSVIITFSLLLMITRHRIKTDILKYIKTLDIEEQLAFCVESKMRLKYKMSNGTGYYSIGRYRVYIER